MKQTKICENTIENITFELYTNQNKKSYQQIRMTNQKGEYTIRNIIAPVDFYTITTAIMTKTKITELIQEFQDTWAANSLEDMIKEITTGDE